MENSKNSFATEALWIVEKWYIENGFTVNPYKDELVLFTYKQKLSKIKLSTLKLRNETKYLGVVLP